MQQHQFETHQVRVKFPRVPGQGDLTTAKKRKNVLLARPGMWVGKTGPRISTSGQCEIARRHDERAGFYLRHNTVTDRDQMLLRSPSDKYPEPRARAAPRDDRISVDLLLEMFPVQFKSSQSSSRYPENYRCGAYRNTCAASRAGPVVGNRAPEVRLAIPGRGGFNNRSTIYSPAATRAWSSRLA